MTTEERLHKMEQELTSAKRRGRWLLTTSILLILSCLTIAATGVPTVIQATRFQLVDANGKLRAELGMAKTGPALLLLDENSKPSATLTLIEGEPYLMVSAGGKVGGILSMEKNRPRLKLADEDGNVEWSAP